MANLAFFVCLFLAVCTVSLSADQVFVSIDCGSSAATYKDENGIVWTGDEKYVKTGESHSMQPSNSVSHVMDTLRVFKNKTKNCYNIDSMKQGWVLVRASFYYGNYDGKNSPPSFYLMFDSHKWGIINTSGPSAKRFEVIYVMKKESISVCVGQIEEGQFLLISTLEVRSLESYMYSDVAETYPLFIRRRLAYGSNATIRFPDDPYDRIWTTDVFAPINGTIQVSSDALLSSGTLFDAVDNPPPAVLKSAITSTAPNSTVNLFFALPPSDVSIYINLYFSEVTRLKPNQTRSFNVFKDNKPFSDLVLPPYKNCTQLYAGNVTASSSTTFSLVPATNSTLPPLINALEVFVLGEALNNGTDKNDVQGLGSLQEEFGLLQEWTGDPCLPYSDCAWEWVKCNYDYVSPRVTTLLLRDYGLSGLLPDFSSMDALETINLSNNSLRGNIPDFLGALPNLQILNLENNQFNGTIPDSLLTKKGLILRVSGNPGLKCLSNMSCSVSAPPPKPNSSVRTKKNILESLLATITPFIIALQLF